MDDGTGGTSGALVIWLPFSVPGAVGTTGPEAPRGRAALLRTLHDVADLIFWEQGGALLLQQSASGSATARSISRAANALAEVPVDLIPQVDILATRRQLLAAIRLAQQQSMIVDGALFTSLSNLKSHYPQAKLP